jgi:uncharacterized protein Veg
MLEEKMIITGIVEHAKDPFPLKFRNITAYFPGGKIGYFHDIHSKKEYSGNIRYVSDAAKKNVIEFFYYNTGQIKEIFINRPTEYMSDPHFKDNPDTSFLSYKKCVFSYNGPSGTLDKIDLYKCLKDHEPELIRELNRYKCTKDKKLRKVKTRADENSPFLVTAYNYTDLETLKIAITYPSGGLSTYYFDLLECDCDIDGNGNVSYYYRPVCVKNVYKESGEHGLEGKTQKTTVYDYYSPTRLHSMGFEYPAGWDEWEGDTTVTKEEPKDASLTNTSGEEKRNSDGPKDYRIAGASIYDGQKKELVTFETWGGMQKKFIFITENDALINFDRVAAYSYDNVLDEYYELKRKRYYFSPLSRKNFGTMQYDEVYGYDFLG